jgi:hypothetical protein
VKLIIAGTRTFHFDQDFIYEAILASIGKYERFPKIDEVISGGATGIDTAAKKYAEAWEVPFKEFPADWNSHGKMAGPIRNEEMARYGDALLLIWDGKSRGSLNMRRQMQVLNKPIYEVVIK